MTHTPEVRPATFRARVKPLEWKVRQRDKMRVHTAFTDAGKYDVVAFGRWGQYEIEVKILGKPGYTDGIHESVTEAKAACQRDHDARVRALLIIEDDHDTDR